MGLLAVAATVLGIQPFGDEGGQTDVAAVPAADEKPAEDISILVNAPPLLEPRAAPAASARLRIREAPVNLRRTPPPQIAGRAAAMIEEPCGVLVYALNDSERLAPASLAKIATALVAAERTEPSAMVDIKVDGAGLAATTDSTVMGLTPGQRLSMRDLLYGLLLPSGNDAALTIAEYVGGTVQGFVGLMNQEVRQLGLSDTHFTNPHGLDENNSYTSAFDIAVLGRELMRQPELAAIVRAQTYQPAWEGPLLWNNNLFLYSYPGALGIKIGYTDEAGATIVAAAEQRGRLLVVSVLKSPDPYWDATLLMDWAFSQTSSACERRSAGD